MPNSTMKLLKIGTTDFLSSVILSIPNMVRRIISIMTKLQWASLTLSGLIFIVGYNILLAKRDAKMLLSPPQLEQPTYKQIPVIPYAE